MTHAWNAVFACLDAKLITLTGITNALIAWPGITFTPPASGLWYKVDCIPATTDYAMGVNGSTHERGGYQVTVYAKPGAGTGALMAAADALVSLFDRAVLTGTTVTVHCGVPVPGPVLQEPDWLGVPVSIPFLAL